MKGGCEPGDCSGATATPGLVEHFFRHDYGRLVAVLTRNVGVRHLDLVEDAVQSALLAALTAWTAQGRPDDPGAWPYRVAYNNLMGDLRRTAGRLRILERAVDADAEGGDPPPPSFFAGELADDMLRMLFVCCDEAIPRESQLALALKTLCGSSTAEIALRLFTSEAHVYKRLARARDRLREVPTDVETPPLDTLRSRLSAVHTVLYLLFPGRAVRLHEVDDEVHREIGVILADVVQAGLNDMRVDRRGTTMARSVDLKCPSRIIDPPNDRASPPKRTMRCSRSQVILADSFDASKRRRHSTVAGVPGRV